MQFLFNKSLRQSLSCFAIMVFLFVPLVGCGQAPEEKTTEQIEKNRIDHGERAAREAAEG